MFKVISEVKFQGDFKEFLNFLRTNKKFYASSPKELLVHARDIAKRLDEQLPRFFKHLPRQPYGVAPVPLSIAPKYTGGRYIPLQKMGLSWFYWVNTYNLPSRPLFNIPALTAHEAVPGHHLQGALNKELQSLFLNLEKIYIYQHLVRVGDYIVNFWQRKWVSIPPLMKNLVNYLTQCGEHVGW